MLLFILLYKCQALLSYKLCPMCRTAVITYCEKTLQGDITCFVRKDISLDFENSITRAI